MDVSTLTMNTIVKAIGSFYRNCNIDYLITDINNVCVAVPPSNEDEDETEERQLMYKHQPESLIVVFASNFEFMSGKC